MCTDEGILALIFMDIFVPTKNDRLQDWASCEMGFMQVAGILTGL